MVVRSLNAPTAPNKDLPVDSTVNVGRNMKNVTRREGLQDASDSMVFMCPRDKLNIHFKVQGALGAGGYRMAVVKRIVSKVEIIRTDKSLEKP